MKKLLLGLFALATISISAQITTPQPSPKAKLEQKVGLTDVTVTYSRPGKKGRTIFGDLVPFNKIWRTGANENTTVTFSNDIVIDGKTLKKGTYALYTKPNANSWEIYFYSDAKNWGNPKKWDDAKVALKTSVTPTKTPLNVETFTIEINDITNNSANLYLLWDTTSASIPFTVPTDKLVTASIEKTINPKPKAGDYYGAAVYYLDAGKDINQAKQWIDKAVEMNQNDPKFWILYRQALIHKKTGDIKTAKKAAQQSLELSKKAGYDAYIKMNEALLKSL